MAISEFLEDLVSHLPSLQLLQQVGYLVCIEGEQACPREDVGGVDLVQCHCDSGTV